MSHIHSSSFSIIHKHPYKSKQSMNLSPLSIALHLFLFFFFFIITFSTADVSINCGSSGTSAARNGRQWLGDSLPKLSNSLVQLNGVSTTSTIANKLSSADPVPHKTARLSRSRFSYAIQVNPGQIIIRLHFNPSPYKGFKGLNDLFTVEVGPFTLLSNFSASIRAAALGVNTFAKEFYICIEENQTLSIAFSSVSSSQSRDTTFAFINGIEIISVPMHLSYFKGGDIGVQVIGKKSLIYVDSSTALELIHRLNAKQDSVLATDEFDDVLGVWGKVPNPKENDSNNLTWITPVDIGFRYLVRIHFSNMGFKKALSEGVIFKVQINGKIVDSNVDILEEKEDHGILRYRDYMLAMKGRKQEGKRDLLISFQSYDEFMDGYKLIKGFEIFKLSNTDNSLSSPNALSFVRESQSLIIRNLEPFVGYRNAIVTVVVSVVVVVNIIVYMLRVIWEAISIEEQNKPSAKAERLCRHFSLTEIQLATKNFSDGLLIGRGGFGKVYKGLIDRGQTTVAIKRLKSNSRQGALEFLTEIETLSELRHINLVSLIGYCNERGEMILVYDYMSGGTLADHLYKLQRENEDVSSLTWKQRLNICIGAGRGLDYLHTGHGVIHRDVKASNILLDENLVAKVSDFGLAKIEDRSTLKTHVSTNVKGTRGYLDPHYINTSNLTRKSDVYAFGVVLLEVLCGRPPLDWGVSEDERILTMWARDKISKGEADEIVALTLREEITPNSLKTFVGIAQRCLHDEPKNRPTMSQIVLQLEFALDQQDTKQNFVYDEIARSSHNIRSSTSDDAINQSSTSQPTTASTNMQNLLLRPNKQSYRKVANALSYGRNNQAKSRRDKPSSRLWPWDSFWNRVKASKKIEFSFPEEEICEADLKLPKFDWDTIAAATNQFSSLNQVSLGIYGLVYKAALPPSGQTVAVKRLLSSLSSRQSVFKNEIALLPYLHHRNIIKLLGYCIHGEERLLVYEFMENTSLLHTWFDEQCKHPPWSVRFKIILGIVQGLIYLHQDSHLRVIHKDLKSANILLDIDMNPKISNFAVAKTLVDYQTEFETSPNAGTHGYMSPEYEMQGIFSVKSDVYSFGIIVLEIISGRTALEYSPIMETTVSLPEYAWKMWSEKKAVDLVDSNLLEFQHDEVLRCIQVGLLCTEEQPHDRPTMPSVLKMLLGDEPLMEPKKPWPPGLKDSVHISEHRDGVDSNATYEFDDTLER